MTTHADRLTTHADRSPFFIALVVVDVLAGLADAISGPYFVLFLVDQARLSPDVPCVLVITAPDRTGCRDKTDGSDRCA